MYMNSFITEKGFKRPDFDEILSELGESSKLFFGEEIALDDKSLFGKLLRIIAYNTARLYEDLETAYYARFPHTATGLSLDRQCVLSGIKRNPATASRQKVTFTGTPEYTIPTGFEVSTAAGITFATENDYTIESNGQVSAYVVCTETGTAGNVANGAITEIVNPDSDVESVSNSEIISKGEEEETDTELRKRFDEAILGSGSGTVDAIKGAIMRCTNVRGCIVVENNEDTAVNGIPAHSFICYVSAPESSDGEIAQAIFDKKPIGILCCGNIEATAFDKTGGEHQMRFSRVSNKPIYVKIQVSEQNAADNVAELIQEAVSAKITKLTNGEDVILSSLYAPILEIDGVKDVKSIELSTDAQVYVKENITVAVSEIAYISSECVDVKVSQYEDK